MLKKDLRLNSYSVPQLVIFYKKANKNVFGKEPYVLRKVYNKFSVMEDDLRELGISPRHYADTVVAALKKWCIDKHMGSVPVNIFISDFAMRKYQKITGYESVKITPDHTEELLWTELLVLRSYIYKNLQGEVVRLRDEIEELRPLLYKGWLDLYDNGGTRPTQKALDMLAEEYGLNGVKSINDILKKALTNRRI